MRVLGLAAVALLAAAGQGCYENDCHCSGSAPYYNIYIYVDPVFGNDFYGNGTPAYPFRSITQSMRFAISGDAIFLAKGNYGTASGELFPIAIKPGVLVQGDPATKGSGPGTTAVSGGGVYTIGGGSQAATTVTATFVMGSGATLSGVKITAPGPGGVGVVFDGISATVSDCTLTGCGASGVRVYQAGSPGITNNVIQGNTASGVDVFDAAAPSLRLNSITANADGVVANDASTPNLGDAATAGGNTLQSNTGVGLNNNTTASAIQAVGNTWRLSTQGSDASGNYAAVLTPGVVAPAAANNFAIPNAAAAIQF